MKVNNPLSRDFLLGYPAEAARVLEMISADHVAALFNELSPQVSCPVVASMSPKIAAASVGLMSVSPAAELLAELPPPSIARIYRYLTPERKTELSGVFPAKIRKQLQPYLDYPFTSAGALLNPEVDRLPDSVTVADAIRRVERSDRPVSCEIYITNDIHQLVGKVDLGSLLTSNHNARLREIMSKKTQPVSAHVNAESLLSHPGWETRRRLPVVERDNTLIGVLDYSSLQKSTEEAGIAQKRDPFENILSLVGLYWLSLAQLLDSMLNIAQQNKEER